MSATEVILRLGLITLLGIYLLRRYQRRVPAAAPRPEDPSWWTGHGIDTRQLRPALGSARAGYRNAMRTTRSATEGARRLAEAGGRGVGRDAWIASRLVLRNRFCTDTVVCDARPQVSGQHLDQIAEFSCDFVW